MGRGKFKGKPTGHRHFSTPEELQRLALIRQQRAEAAKKREEEKAAREQKKAEARK
ncbi:Casein kinase substrate, phosphoprotein PP28 [Corchorus capsularis]|uniref:Casein kinase substrate, phosphoprotein PP28 n=1 Tax=Corchorus capsularis TaxID=210143 RepID=A0A1R3HX26_COCAP|nr:Casein kinase substrate, phosphoprotein PP28 [Corchorus capsularis]